MLDQLRALGGLLPNLDPQQLLAAARRALGDRRVREARSPRLRKHLLIIRLAKEGCTCLPFPMLLMVQNTISELPKVLQTSSDSDLVAIGEVLRDIGAVLADRTAVDAHDR